MTLPGGDAVLTDSQAERRRRLRFLTHTHEVYNAWADIWERNEARLAGGDEVVDELVQFDWEEEQGDHYTGRQEMATYINFPEMFATALLGHLMRQAPQPEKGLSFGSMGEVRTLVDLTGEPTEAELIYYNTDGTGGDGSQWDNWWDGIHSRAFATGHRWFLVEAPSTPATRRSDVLAGARPYLVEYSPLDVPDWHFERGQLAYAIIRVGERRPRVVDGEMTDEAGGEPDYLLMVRRGFDRLGAEYAGGGWWRYSGDFEELERGVWDKTAGEIPLGLLFYQRAKGRRAMPALSRPGITELGSIAISYMNLSSAADFDAWDAASSITFLLGVDPAGFNVTDAIIKNGSKYVPVPPNADQEGVIPAIQDSGAGAVAAQVFEMRLDRKMAEAQRVSATELTTTPDASGAAKEAGFNEIKAPRLSALATERETAQNTAIRWLEMRAGHAPAGGVVWPRSYDLVAVAETVEGLFNREKLAGYRSPTLGARAMVMAAKEEGLVKDAEDEALIEAEYQDAAEKAEQAADQEATLRREMGG